MKLVGLRHGGALAAGVLILASGCTSGTTEGSASTPAVSLPTSPPVNATNSLQPSSRAPPSLSRLVIEPSASEPVSSEISQQEAADRAAIEAQWKQFWIVVLGAIRLPEDEREPALSRVSVDPLKAKILDEVRESEANGLDRYGAMTQHPYWEEPVDGGDIAVMGDCQDASQSGVVNVATGRRETVGVADNNVRTTFERGPDQVWRVKEIHYLVDAPCPFS